MSSGKIVQIIGAVVDVEFQRGSMPKVFDALQVDDSARENLLYNPQDCSSGNRPKAEKDRASATGGTRKLCADGRRLLRECVHSSTLDVFFSKCP